MALSSPLLISHAGCAGHAPENTLAGVAAALALGADAVEVDVRATADGVPVLLHDETVDRTTDGHGPIDALSLAQVRRLRAGGPGHPEERVPTLEEAGRLLAGRALLVAEVKQPGIEAAVVRAIEATVGLQGAQVWSFWPQVLASLARLRPDLPRVLLLPAGAPLPLDLAQELALWGLALRHETISPQMMAPAREAGLRLYAWTVDDAAAMARLLALGVDGIVTDYPERARALIPPRH
jgi:glycerophosphoryl diester phosphodiesterase